MKMKQRRRSKESEKRTKKIPHPKKEQILKFQEIFMTRDVRNVLMEMVHCESGKTDLLGYTWAVMWKNTIHTRTFNE